MRYTYHPETERTIDPDALPQMRQAFEQAVDEISNPFVQDWVDALINALAKHLANHPKGPDDRLARHDAVMAIAAMVWLGK